MEVSGDGSIIKRKEKKWEKRRKEKNKIKNKKVHWCGTRVLTVQ